MTYPIVSRPKPKLGRWVVVLALIGALAVLTAVGAAILGARMEAVATPADIVGSPVRAQTAHGDRVFLLTSQWKTFRTRYSRHGITRPAYTALQIDVWAFDAATGAPVWRRRLESERRGVNAGRAVLGAERDVLWLLTSRGLVGLSPKDGATVADAAAIEAKNPALASLVPNEIDLFRFDASGLGFRSADGRDWRLDSATLLASAASGPSGAAAGAFTPAKLSGGVSTWAFHERGLHLTGRWLGFLSQAEAERSAQRRSLDFARIDEAPRMRLWSARTRPEATFFGARTVLSDFEPLPESPEFLRGGLLSDGNLQNRPVLLREPDSVLVLHWDSLGEEGQLKLSRVAGPAGRVLWTADLPMARLDAVMPGERTLVLMGSRREPDLRRPRERQTVEVDQLAAVDLQTGRTGLYGFRFKTPSGSDLPPSSTPPAVGEK